MARAPSPIVRRRRLGVELRRLREAAGLTGDQVIERIGWASASKLSRIENGRSRSDVADVKDLLELYGVAGRLREQLLAIARDAGNTRAWLQAYPVMTPRQRGYAELEAGCSEILEYGQLIVPGLLQTPDYARCRIEAAPPIRVPAVPGVGRPGAGRPGAPRPGADAPPVTDEEVAARTARQSLLQGDGDPPRYEAVLEESAFTGRAGPPDVLGDQLEHLCRLADLPHVTLRVLPPGAVIGEYYLPATAFSIYQFADPDDASTVAIEALGSDLLLNDDATLRHYLRVFDWLRAAARPREDSRRWLADAATAARRRGADGAEAHAAPPAQRGSRTGRARPRS